MWTLLICEVATGQLWYLHPPTHKHSLAVINKKFFKSNLNTWAYISLMRTALGVLLSSGQDEHKLWEQGAYTECDGNRRVKGQKPHLDKNCTWGSLASSLWAVLWCDTRGRGGFFGFYSAEVSCCPSLWSYHWWGFLFCLSAECKNTSKRLIKGANAAALEFSSQTAVIFNNQDQS